MISIGQHQDLTILRHTSVGLYLGDESGEDVLLPNKYCPEKFTIGEKLNVFVYRDYEERKIATNLRPKILMHQFALLRVTSVSNVGAFMDWGLEKELLVPFREQRQKMEEGRWYIVYLDLDKETDRLYATNKIEKKLQNKMLTASEGDAVDVLVMKKTDLGFSVIVNQQHEGLIFESDIFGALNIGDKVKGYVKQIRDDNKLDISLQPIGFENFNDPNCDMILTSLKTHKGFLPIADKSTPEEIYTQFGISKKAYKKAIGTLYKQRKIMLQPDGIKLI
ncbi:MAG: S1-like domain-containing RNA-binding protein [Cyclobacteriaceae bacterium]